jgi:DNA-binding NarL/FixJ family response regulator
MGQIRVVIADDHPMIRYGLLGVLRMHPQFIVVGEASSGDEAVRKTLQEKPDVIILDINMPGMDGITAATQIKTQLPEIKILMMTVYTDEEYLKSSLAAGVSGYIIKKAADTELITALQTILEGESYIYPTLIPKLFLPGNNSKPTIEKEKEPGDKLLSDREKEVLRLISLGYTQKEIAEKLFISIKTVETHKARILEKLGVHKRSDLVRYALKYNMISDETV